MADWPLLLVRHPVTAPALRCRSCAHPIRLVEFIGWIDTTPPVYGGLYDFCTATHGAHLPEA